MARRARPPPLPVTVLRGHSSSVQAVCFLGEDVLLSGSQDGFVKVWDLERRRVCAEFEATSHGMGVQRLDRLGRNRVVSQGRDGIIKVWDAEKLACGCTGATAAKNQRSGPGNATPGAPAPEPLLELPTGAFHFCQFALTRWREEPTANDDGASGSSRVREERGGEELRRGRGGESNRDLLRNTTFDDVGSGPERGLQGKPRGKVGGGGFCDREGEARSQSSGEDPEFAGEEGIGVAPAATVPTEECPSSGSFADNTMLAPCSEQHSVCLWDLRARAPSFTISPADAERKGMVMCVRLLGESASCASPFAVCGHDSGYLCVYDVRATSAAPLMESRLHDEPLLCVDIGSSCTQGVSGSAGDSVNVFKINTKKGLCEVVKKIRSEHPGTSCVEIRRDQRLFISGGWDHRVRTFSWKSPRPLAVLRSHEGSVYAVAHSPRIGGFVSGSADSRVAVWDMFPDR
ncbi:unnamed protein product [Laminaria digitata]